MANSLCFAPVASFKSPTKPGIVIGNSVAGKFFRPNDVLPSCMREKFQTLKVKATESDKTAKVKSLVCPNCDGNGAILCTQCKGSGVNSTDHFNGQFKAGGLCWLCRGKREILCGNCNGAGFIGGFMNSPED